MGWFSEATPPQKQAPIAPVDLLTRARAALAAPDNDLDVQELLYLVAPLAGALEAVLAERDRWRVACMVLKGDRDRWRAECTAVKARVAELEAGLRPFAAKGAGWSESGFNASGKRDECPMPNAEGLTMGDCRRAAQLLDTTPRATG